MCEYFESPNKTIVTHRLGVAAFVGGVQMSKLKWSWVYYPYLDPPEKQQESALKAGYNKVYLKSEADKTIAHHKYRRCLAMADRCRERFHHYVVLVCFSPNKGAIPFYERKRDIAYKWIYKWLEIAKKFKENK